MSGLTVDGKVKKWTSKTALFVKFHGKWLFLLDLQIAAHLLGVSGTPEDQQILLTPAQTPPQAECFRGD